jgi:hypothetical protein
VDVSSVGPIEQLTYYIASILSGAFALFPNHDAAGNVIGIPVLSFYAETRETWPNIVVRMTPGETPRSAIGNISEVNLDPVMPDAGTGALLPGQTAETIIAENAMLEFRLGARNEVERERMLDWAWRVLEFRIPLPDGSPSVLDQLGAYGITVKTLGAPALPDIDASASRPQGMPPMPGQLFVTCRAEFTVVLDPAAATVTVVPPTQMTGFGPSPSVTAAAPTA